MPRALPSAYSSHVAASGASAPPPYAEGGRRRRPDHLVTSDALCRGWPSAYGFRFFFFTSSQLVSAQNDSNIIAK